MEYAFVNVLKKYFLYKNNIFYFMEDMYTKRSEESKKGIKIYMRVRSKKE